MKILLVENNTVQGEATQKALQCSGYVVEWVTRGDDALYLLTMVQYDIVILNSALPGMDGLEVLQCARGKRILTPIILITSKGSLEECVAGLDLGADDYLTKPFDMPELEARLRALARRYYNSNFSGLSLGSLYFDLNRRRAYIADQPVPLSSRELALLEALLLRIGQVLSKDQLSENIYGLEEGAAGNAIEVYIHRLRKKLAPSGVKIQTVKGQGYMIEKVR